MAVIIAALVIVIIVCAVCGFSCNRWRHSKKKLPIMHSAICRRQNVTSVIIIIIIIATIIIVIVGE